MVTFLEIGLIRYFSVIFPALLVFVVVYALLQRTKILGENKTVHATAAIVLAFILMLSEDITTIINFIAPWFVLLFIFVVLLLVVYKLMGATDEDLTGFIRTDKLTQWTIFIIGIVIVISAMAHVYGERLLPITQEEVPEGVNVTAVEAAPPAFGVSVAKVFFHPKVIGLIFIFLVAVFTIGLLTRETV